jgi:hypothetical protein
MVKYLLILKVNIFAVCCYYLLFLVMLVGLVKTKDEFMMAKKNFYKYDVLRGNHFACAKMDLARAHLHNNP